MEYGCIGERLTHSFSKEIHKELFDYKYELCELKAEELSEFFARRDFCATNVTIPYKEAVIPFLDEIDEKAKKIGAVNTVVNRNGRLYGYNTDFSGMCALIKKNNIEIEGKTVLILGSGGTSKTAEAVSYYLGAKEVVRVSRSGRDGAVDYEKAYRDYSYAEVIINTTPCGMYPNNGEMPIKLDAFKDIHAVVDAIYNPLRSALVVQAENRGITAVGGLYMLVSQAAFAAELFTGKSVKTEKTDKIYKNLFNSKQNIVLIGMPSSGKTTLGKSLAKSLNMDFVDSDEEIVNRAGKTVVEIFVESGEKGFREMESDVIAELSKRQNTVIATGGGAVLREKNIASLKENGRIYFLDRPLDLLLVTSDRPLSSDRENLEKRYRERYGLYCSAADKTIANEGEIKVALDNIRDDFLG